MGIAFCLQTELLILRESSPFVNRKALLSPISKIHDFLYDGFFAVEIYIMKGKKIDGGIEEGGKERAGVR